MFNALLLTVLTALAVGESQAVKVDDRTEVKITLKQDGIQVNWDCAESNMKYVSEYYKTNKFRWDFYKGEALDCFYSPHSRANSKTVAYPAYRIMANPGNYFFRAFLAVSRPNPAVRHAIVQKADGWQAEWFFPFAAEETFDFRKNSRKNVTFVPGFNWSFKFSRRSQTSGKTVVTQSQVVTIPIPAEVIAPYRQVIFASLNHDKKGNGIVVSAAVRNTSAKEFAGKVRFYLHSGKDIKVAATREIRLPAKGAVRVSSPVDLPELAVKFSVHLEVVDQEDRPVRISAEMPVENPWVEF
jgi:hypothetical protein